MNKKITRVIIPLLIVIVLASAFLVQKQNVPIYSDSVMDVPPFSGDPYVIINDNEPEFSESDMTQTGYEYYSDLDFLGRCGYAMACIGKEMMPTEDRGSIGQVKPSGWQTIKYDFVDGKYLYNRCHLIGFQLAGENANERNLITGTRYLNVDGMLPFENMVADYINETGNHVIYRVTPIFDGDALVARGVQMEAKSVEDNGDGICFNVYAYNNQPGIQIDYTTGKSTLIDDETTGSTGAESEEYILNISTKKFHSAACEQGQKIKDENKQKYTGNREDLLGNGYSPAGCCEP
jgi:DNA-entry nuclease